MPFCGSFSLFLKLPCLKNIFSPSSYGAVVFLVPTGSDMKCVLKSQMIRLLAYALPFIRDEDIIVTADVDAFIMTQGNEV